MSISAWILIGIVLFLVILFLYILSKVSQDNDQATSLNLEADEPVLKGSTSKKRSKGGR